MNNTMKQKIITLVNESFKGDDGKPSSKKMTAFWFVVLITIIVIVLLVMICLAVFLQLKISLNAVRMIELAGTNVLFALVSAVLLLYGVSGWQQVKSLKILNPAPSGDTTNIIQQPSIETANINNTDKNNDK